MKEFDTTSEPGVRTAQFAPNAPSSPDASKVTQRAYPHTTPARKQDWSRLPCTSPRHGAFPVHSKTRFAVSSRCLWSQKGQSRGSSSRVAGKVVFPDKRTGRFVSETFEDTPQAACTDLKLEYAGNNRAFR